MHNLLCMSCQIYSLLSDEAEYWDIIQKADTIQMNTYWFSLWFYVAAEYKRHLVRAYLAPVIRTNMIFWCTSKMSQFKSSLLQTQIISPSLTLTFIQRKDGLSYTSKVNVICGSRNMTSRGQFLTVWSRAEAQRDSAFTHSLYWPTYLKEEKIKQHHQRTKNKNVGFDWSFFLLQDSAAQPIIWFDLNLTKLNVISCLTTILE